MDGHWAKDCPKRRELTDADPRPKAKAKAKAKAGATMRTGLHSLDGSGDGGEDPADNLEEVFVGLGSFVDLSCLDGVCDDELGNDFGDWSRGDGYGLGWVAHWIDVGDHEDFIDCTGAGGWEASHVPEVALDALGGDGDFWSSRPEHVFTDGMANAMEGRMGSEAASDLVDTDDGESIRGRIERIHDDVKRARMRQEAQEVERKSLTIEEFSKTFEKRCHVAKDASVGSSRSSPKKVATEESGNNVDWLTFGDSQVTTLEEEPYAAFGSLGRHDVSWEADNLTGGGDDGWDEDEMEEKPPGPVQSSSSFAKREVEVCNIEEAQLSRDRADGPC